MLFFFTLLTPFYLSLMTSLYFLYSLLDSYTWIAILYILPPMLIVINSLLRTFFYCHNVDNHFWSVFTYIWTFVLTALISLKMVLHLLKLVLIFFFLLLCKQARPNDLMETKGGKKKSSSSKTLFYEAPLGYGIEDVRPHGGIKKFKSAAYSNVSISLLVHYYVFVYLILLLQGLPRLIIFFTLCSMCAVRSEAILRFSEFFLITTKGGLQKSVRFQ